MGLRRYRVLGSSVRALVTLGVVAALIVPAAAQQPAPRPSRPPLRVVEVVVQGNKAITVETLLRVIATRPGDLVLSDRLAADVQSIIALGWFADVVVRVEEVPGGARVVFVVVENPIVARIVISGNTVIPTDQLLGRLGVPVGQVLNSNALRDGLRAIETLYDERGYILARVSNVEITGDGVLTLTIGEGRIQEIRIKGLKRTVRRVVERELTMKKNDVFNVNQVNADLQRIFNLGLFETVRVVPQPGDAPDTVIVEIELVEQRTGEVKFGIGYSTRQGIIGSVEISDTNYKGRAQRLSFRFERSVVTAGAAAIPGVPVIGSSEPVAQYEIAFQEPFFDSQRTAVAIRVFRSVATQTDYASGSQFVLDQFGAQVSASRPIGKDGIGALTLRSINTGLVGLAGATIPLTPGVVHAIGAAWIRDRRNDRLNPTKGDRLSLNLDYAFTLVGGDFSFIKGSAEYTRYFPLSEIQRLGRFRDAVLVLHGFVGAGTPSCGVTPAPGCLPLQEEFTLGGQGSLRGYFNSQFRGNLAALANVEIRFPLQSISPRMPAETMGIVFADAGFASRTGLTFGTKTAGYNVGIGVLVQTPLGPIRIDYGIGPRGSQTWLQFGHPF